MAFDSSFNLSTLFPDYTGDDARLVYQGGQIYSRYIYSTTSSFIYRFNPLDTNNKAMLTNSKFYRARGIAVDASNVYYYSSQTPNKIYSIPLLFDSSSNITDIDISGNIGTSGNEDCWLCITTNNFYILKSNFLYTITRSNNEISKTINYSGSINLQINNGILYYMNDIDYKLYSIDASDNSVELGQLPNSPTLLGNQMTIFNNIIYIPYKIGTAAVYLGLYNISTSSVISQVSTNLPGNAFSGITINTGNRDMYVKQPYSDFIYKAPVNTYCFNKGTKILCMNQQQDDEYINIELLQIGDFVKTYKHGYRKVSRVISGTFINNPKKWNMCMYKMEKTPTNGLIEDLIVTGGHSLLVDAISDEEQKKYDEMGISGFSKLTIDNKRLLLACVSDQFSPIQDNDVYTYYHLLLENNNDEEERFGIWANGILTETPNEKTIK